MVTSRSRSTLLLAVVFLGCVSMIAADTWPCTWDGIDFCSLKPAGATPFVTFKDTSGTPYEYLINVGGDISAAQQQYQCTDTEAPMARVLSSFGVTICDAVGSLFAAPTWATIASKANYSASFASSDKAGYKNALTIYFVCDKTGAGVPTLTQMGDYNNKYQYIVTWGSAVACGGSHPQPHGPGGGGFSGGDAFLVIFFVGGFLFFACGMGFNYRFRQARGLQTVPFLDFWKDLPFLVKDGFMYTLRLGRCVRGGGSSGGGGGGDGAFQSV